MNISEGLGWLKTLQSRQADLTNLRNDSSKVRFSSDNTIQIKPNYDPRVLDRRIVLISREIRLLTAAIKAQNAKCVLEGYKYDDAVLGELE